MGDAKRVAPGLVTDEYDTTYNLQAGLVKDWYVLVRDGYLT